MAKELEHLHECNSGGRVHLRAQVDGRSRIYWKLRHVLSTEKRCWLLRSDRAGGLLRNRWRVAPKLRPLGGVDVVRRNRKALALRPSDTDGSKKQKEPDRVRSARFPDV